MLNLLSPTNVATGTAFVLLVHGTLHTLAPAPTAEKYKIPDNETGNFNTSIRSTGCNLLLTAIIAGGLLLEVDRYQSIALGCSVWCIEHLSRVLNRDGSKHAGSDIPNAIMTAINAVLVYGLCNDAWAPLTAKIGMVLLFVFGLGFALWTEFFLVKIWLIDEKRVNDPKHGPFHYFLCRAFGVTMTQSAVLLAAIELGNLAIVHAFGISCAFLALGILWVPFASCPEVADETLKKSHVAMALGCAVASFLMLKGGDLFHFYTLHLNEGAFWRVG